jgi:RNA polymerase sigma-70 factor (ECF subfamily)
MTGAIQTVAAKGNSTGSVLDGDCRALYKEHFPYVCKSLRRLGVDANDVKDVAHDVFVVALRRLKDFDRSRSGRPWLFGILYRVVGHYHRSARRRLEVVEDTHERTDGRLGAEEMAAAAKAQSVVLDVLEKLNLERRAVIVMHDIEEFTMPEIADALGIPLNTGYSRLRLARAEFVAELQHVRQRPRDPEGTTP